MSLLLLQPIAARSSSANCLPECPSATDDDECWLAAGNPCVRWNSTHAVTNGAGELSIPFVISTSTLLVRSLGSALLPFGFVLLDPVVSLLTSPEKESRLGASQVDIAHCAPVNDLITSGLCPQRRHGLPERSSARRPALMAPVLAFGPSLCADIGLAPGTGVFFAPSCERSIVPSALLKMLVLGSVFKGTCLMCCGDRREQQSGSMRP